MKKLVIAFLVLLPALIAAQNYYSAQRLILDLNISNTLLVEPTKADYSLKRVTADLSYFPREDFQQSVESLTVSPSTTLTNGSYRFQWVRPDTATLDFLVSARISTTNELAKISEKVAFPIATLDPGLKDYVVETPTIDYRNSQIMDLAGMLASGENDLYVVVHKMAAWVNENIDYNLNTKTADASQKASWVIQNRQGVCDELTNLFIGLCRAVGIPARFVSGISYTNVETFENPWSPHGWAEVYFPGHGWIPFDVTYGELGYINPAHIKLKDSVDANKSSTRYEWEGYNADIRTERLQLSTAVISAVGLWDTLVPVDARIYKESVGFGSYNVVMVILENPHEYYVPLQVYLSRTDELAFTGKEERFVLLAPHQTKREFWILKVTGDLIPQYLYNFTIKAYTERNASKTVSFFASESSKVYSLDEMKVYVAGMKEEATKTYSRNVALDCTAAQSHFYVGQEVIVTCVLRNIGNSLLQGIEVCMDTQCKSWDIGIGASETMQFKAHAESSGSEDRTVTARAKDVLKTAEVSFAVWEKPTITIEELSYPSEVDLTEKFTIEFKLTPKAPSVPQQVQVTLTSAAFQKDWAVDELESGRKYILNVDHYTLSEVNNQFRIVVSYQDTLGRRYQTTQDFLVRVKSATLRERGVMMLNRINLQLKYDMIIIVTAVFVAGIVVGLIFHQARRRR